MDEGILFPWGRKYFRVIKRRIVRVWEGIKRYDLDMHTAYSYILLAPDRYNPNRKQQEPHKKLWEQKKRHTKSKACTYKHSARALDAALSLSQTKKQKKKKKKNKKKWKRESFIYLRKALRSTSKVLCTVLFFFLPRWPFFPGVRASSLHFSAIIIQTNTLRWFSPMYVCM